MSADMDETRDPAEQLLHEIFGKQPADTPAPAPVGDVEGLAADLFHWKYERDEVPSSFDQSRMDDLREVANAVLTSDWLAAFAAAQRTEAWDEAVQALAWALDNGPSERALPYVVDHNPYRAEARP